MFIEPGSQRTSKLRRSEIFGLVRGTLRSYGAKTSGNMSYKHLAALRLGHDLWLELERLHTSRQEATGARPKVSVLRRRLKISNSAKRFP